MARGIERREIFRDDEDRERFLVRLAAVVAATGVRCFAFAVMPNHIHLLLETGETPLSQVMLRLGTVHAMDFNRRYDRVGHLFQNRFKSKLIEDDRGVVTVVRYIHLNPVKAGIVPDLETLAGYPWTGHAGLMGRRRYSFLDAASVLSRFAERPGDARRELVRWMELGLASADSDAWPAERLELPTGLLPARDLALGEDARVALESWRRRMREAGWNARRVLEEVCVRLSIDSSALGRGRRTRQASRARDAVAGLAAGALGCTHVEVAACTGVSRQAVEQALARFALWDDRERETLLAVFDLKGAPTSRPVARP